MNYLHTISNTFAAVPGSGVTKRLKLLIIATVTLTAGLTAGLASSVSAGPCNNQYVQISTNVPGRTVFFARYDQDCNAVGSYTQFVASGSTSAAGAIAFEVRPGERVGYRSKATGADYITACGGNFGSEHIGNSVVLTGYIRC